MKIIKYLIIILMASPFLVSCSYKDNKSTENVSIVEKYISSVENLEYNTMSSLLDDDYVGLGPSINDSINKKFALLNWKENVDNLYKTIKYNRLQLVPFNIEEGFNKGEWVSAWAELYITYKSGESVVIWANTAYKLENNLIVKSFTFYNEADALEQLGFVFINPNNL